jgi:hypothetical protein
LIEKELLHSIKQNCLFSFGPKHPLRISLNLFGLILKEKMPLIKKEVGEIVPVLDDLNMRVTYELVVIPMQVITKNDTEPNK